MSRQIIRNGKVIEDDWVALQDDDALPASGKVHVSLDRWQKEKAGIVSWAEGCGGQYGVRIPNTLDVNELGDEWLILSIAVLEFPNFADGRALSQAQVLRRQLGYTGEIRATGDVQRDQMYHMSRSGINAFEVKEGRDIHAAIDSLRDFSFAYQGAADNPTPGFRRWFTQ